MDERELREDRARESRVRRKLEKQGLSLSKARGGLYEVIDPYTNSCLTGGRFDMSLDDVEKYANEGENQR